MRKISVKVGRRPYVKKGGLPKGAMKIGGYGAIKVPKMPKLPKPKLPKLPKVKGYGF